MNSNTGQTLDGAILKARREDIGSSLTSLAEQIDIPKASLWRLEEGRRSSLDIDLVGPLSEGYRLTEMDLLLGLFRIQPVAEQELSMVETAEALRIGRIVLSVEPGFRELLINFIENSPRG